MTLYLDASVIVPLLVTEPTSDALTDWIARQTAPFVVGRLATGEVGSAISRRVRMNQLTPDQGERALSGLDEWLRRSATIVDNIPADVTQAARWVRRPVPKLLMPDAIHLATCLRLGVRLVTADLGLIIVADDLGIDRLLPD